MKMLLSEETISKEIIKPSSPTPIASRTLPLSFLDQIQPPVYPPMLLFYENDSNSKLNHLEVSESLKRSLSQVLAVFYPLAGRLHENNFIDCDDSGVEFVESRVHGRGVQQFRADPKQEELRFLVPVDAAAHTDKFLILIKLCFLDCGGFSLSVCMTHKIGDFPSFAIFINAWAATCRGQTQMSQPFNLNLLFPGKESAPVYFSEEKEEKITTKRVIINEETLEKIRKQEGGCSAVKKPSRVEALSAFIWKIFIKATKAKRDPNKSSFAALHAINLRPRTLPPVPASTFGNCYVGAFAFVESEGDDVVSSLRTAIAEVDDSYIRNVINEEGYLKALDDANKSFQRGDTELCNFSSWWRSPVYGADFGWGKPTWVCPAGLPYKNLVILMSTPSGDGVEAWINMPLDFSEIFDSSFGKLAPAEGGDNFTCSK